MIGLTCTQQGHVVLCLAMCDGSNVHQKEHYEPKDDTQLYTCSK
jgi:hypothetical protein